MTVMMVLMSGGGVNDGVVDCDVGNDDVVGNVAPGDGDLSGVYYLVNTDQPFPDVCSLYCNFG